MKGGLAVERVTGLTERPDFLSIKLTESRQAGRRVRAEGTSALDKAASRTARLAEINTK